MDNKNGFAISLISHMTGTFSGQALILAHIQTLFDMNCQVLAHLENKPIDEIKQRYQNAYAEYFRQDQLDLTPFHQEKP